MEQKSLVRRLDIQMDGWQDSWTDSWTDGWMYKIKLQTGLGQTILYVSQCIFAHLLIR